jgi:pilus assembly protein CpaF
MSEVNKHPNWFGSDVEPQLPEHANVGEQQFQQLKSAVHEQLVESLDLSRVREGDQRDLWHHLYALAEETCRTRPELLSALDRERLRDELMSEVFGLGPLEPLMADPDVSDILVNDPYTVYVERHGRLELTPVVFADEQHLMRIIQRIVAKLGRRIDEVSPMVDARLPDGSRINATARPLALDGPTLSIRRFGANPLTIDDLVSKDCLLPEMVQFLSSVVETRLGLLISGGTGAGKTTLLNALSRFIPADERLVTIEDSAELILQHKHRVRLETRPPNTEGRGTVSQRDLVRNSLRMRPDRIIVGEVRGAEVWDMLQAMNTGHEGSLTTIHANSAFDALMRMEMMVAMTGFEIPVNVVRQYIASAISLIVHLARLKGGVRHVMQITELQGVDEHNKYILKNIFNFEQTAVNEAGLAVGQFRCAGALPRCVHRLAQYGIDFPEDFFAERICGSTAPAS